MSNTAFGWVDPTDHTVLALTDDVPSNAQALPFTFSFFDTAKSTLFVSPNGLISFDTGTGSSSISVLPSSSAPHNIICPWWTTFTMQASTKIRIGTEGTAPNRKVVVSWVGIAVFSAPSQAFTFQVILEEGTNDIVLQYLQVQPALATYGAGRQASIGIENSTGSVGVQYSYLGSTLLYNGLAIRFTVNENRSSTSSSNTPSSNSSSTSSSSTSKSLSTNTSSSSSNTPSSASTSSTSNTPSSESSSSHEISSQSSN